MTFPGAPFEFETCDNSILLLNKVHFLLLFGTPEIHLGKSVFVKVLFLPL